MTWTKYIHNLGSMLVGLVVLFAFTYMIAVADPMLKWDLAIAVAADVTFYFGVIPSAFLFAYFSYDYRKLMVSHQEVLDDL